MKLQNYKKYNDSISLQNLDFKSKLESNEWLTRHVLDKKIDFIVDLHTVMENSTNRSLEYIY